MPWSILFSLMWRLPFIDVRCTVKKLNLILKFVIAVTRLLMHVFVNQHDKMGRVLYLYVIEGFLEYEYFTVFSICSCGYNLTVFQWNIGKQHWWKIGTWRVDIICFVKPSSRYNSRGDRDYVRHGQLRQLNFLTNGLSENSEIHTQCSSIIYAHGDEFWSWLCIPLRSYG